MIEGGASAPPPAATTRPGFALQPSWSALALPGLLLLLVIFVYPLVGMTFRSFNDPSPHTYVTFFHEALYGRVLLKTIEISALVTVVCVVLGYPYAYVMAASGPKMRGLLLVLVLLPFWTSWLVRSFAMVALLQDTGVINDALKSLGIIHEPLTLIRTTFGVVFGLSNVLLPFTVLPMFAVMIKVDGRLIQAARSLGASRTQAFWTIFVPATMPGVIAGGFLVFVLSVGFYVTPALLGSPEDMMVGQLIATQFQSLLQFGQGSATAVVLLATVGLVVWLGSRLGPVTRAFRGEI